MRSTERIPSDSGQKKDRRGHVNMALYSTTGSFPVVHLKMASYKTIKGHLNLALYISIYRPLYGHLNLPLNPWLVNPNRDTLTWHYIEPSRDMLT